MNKVITDRLGTGDIGKLLRELSIPAIMGMIINALYNFIDGVFIGRGVGADALGGITVSFPIYMLSWAIILMTATGGSAVFSIALGAGDEEKARKCVGNSYTAQAVTLFFLIALVLIFREPILKLFGSSPETHVYARDFLTYLMPWQIFQGFQILWENFTRAEGNSRIAMVAITIGSVLNIILDYFFVILFGWGVKGAAIATGISMLVSAIYTGAYVFTNCEKLVVGKKYWKPEWKIIKEIYAIGFAAFARQATFSLQSLVLNNSVVYYGGSSGLAIVGILSRIFNFMILPVFGLLHGMRPLMSYNYGAKKYDRTRDTLYLAMKYATGVLLIGFLIAQIFAYKIIGIFTTDASLIKEGARVLRIVTMVFPIISVQMVGSAAFQSIDRPVKAIIFSVIRQILLFIPLLAVMPIFFGVDGIWFTYPLADIAAMILTGIFIRKEMKKLLS